MTSTGAYLDNNATTRVAAECREPVLQAMFEAYGNPSSKHSVGEAAKLLAQAGRLQVAKLLGATPAELVFTGSGTEAVQLALRGALALANGKRRVVTTAVEHSSSLLLLRDLQERQQIDLHELPVDGNGQLRIEHLAQALTADTALLSLAWANNETGVIFPVPEAVELAHRHAIPVHIDAVQAAGKTPINVADLPVDLLSISGHKLHAPKGVGALYVRKGIKLPACILGHQERKRRGGTENVPAIVGFGVAAGLAAAHLQEETQSGAIAALRKRLEQGLAAALPNIRINGAAVGRISNTSSVSVPGIEAELLLDQLDRRGIQASAGAACAAGSTEPSHVLLAMGLSAEEALATVRFSLSRYTTAEEIDYTIATMQELVQSLLAMAA